MEEMLWVGIGLFLTHLAKFGKPFPDSGPAIPITIFPKTKLNSLRNRCGQSIGSYQEKYSKQPINDIDGVKIEFDKEWVI